MSVFQTPLIMEFVAHCKWVLVVMNHADLKTVTFMFTTSIRMSTSCSSPKNFGSESGENVWALRVFSNFLMTDKGQFLNCVSTGSGKSRSDLTQLPCSK